MKTIIALLLMATAAQAADCPPEKPNMRVVEVWPRTMTLLACMPVLVCAPGQIACSRVTSDCNHSAPTQQQLCLSDEELKAAEKR